MEKYLRALVKAKAVATAKAKTVETVVVKATKAVAKTVAPVVTLVVKGVVKVVIITIGLGAIVFIITFLHDRKQERDMEQQLVSWQKQHLQIQEEIKTEEQKCQKEDEEIRKILEFLSEKGKELEEIAEALENPDHYIQAELQNDVLKVEYVENGTLAINQIKEVQQTIQAMRIKEENSSCLEEKKQVEKIKEEINSIKEMTIYYCHQEEIDRIYNNLEEMEHLINKLEEESLGNYQNFLKAQQLLGKVLYMLEESFSEAKALQKKEEQIATYLKSLELEEGEKLPEEAQKYRTCSVVELLARLGNGEASICSDAEMQTVQQVALNRVADERFEDSLIEVIFEENQYACAGNINFSRSYSQKCVDNAVAVLEGQAIVEVPDEIIFQALFKQGKNWSVAQELGFKHYFGY